MNTSNFTHTKPTLLGSIESLMGLNAKLARLFSFIDEHTDDAISKSYTTMSVDDFEEYVLKGKLKVRKPSFLARKISRIDPRYPKPWVYTDASGNVTTYSRGSDASIGFKISPSMRKKFYARFTKNSSMYKHLNITELNDDHVNLLYPAPVRVPLYVALITYVVSTNPHIVRIKSVEDEFLDINSEVLARLIDQGILYNCQPGRLTGIYPRDPYDMFNEKEPALRWPGVIPGTAKEERPEGDHIFDVASLAGDHFQMLISNMAVKYRNGMQWIINRETGRIVNNLKDKNGNSIVIHCNEEGLPVTILGIPVIYNDYMDSVDNSARKETVPVILINMNQAYTFLQGGSQKGPSVRAFGEGITSEKEEIIVLSRYRVGGMLTNNQAVRILRVSNTNNTNQVNKETNNG